ncbi:hypothetical protein [Frankia sp. CiP1_Cm_nod2]|uniref:hypothetical protein n=1 Tax=Frankia sp. CiP1_Cm_nod2 TaxID=2897161 RepID=UPI0020244D9C
MVFIVGDITAKIGDPSGRSDERPALTDEDIARNLATCREQVTPFFDFARTRFRHNGDWLREVRLPQLIEGTDGTGAKMSKSKGSYAFGDVENLPEVAGLGQSVTDAVKALGFARSNVDVRRVAQQNGLRLVVEAEGGQGQITLTADEAREPLAALVKDKLGDRSGDYYLKVGRKLARITVTS